MQKSRFGEEQRVKIRRAADTSPVVQVAKRHGISEWTIYVWRKRFWNPEAVDVERPRQLEHEVLKWRRSLVTTYPGSTTRSVMNAMKP